MTESFVNPSDAEVAATDRTPEVRDHRIKPDLGYIWHLIKQYLKRDAKIGWSMVALKLVFTILGSVAMLQFQVKLAAATNALSAKDAAALWPNISMTTGFIVLIFAVSMINVIVNFTLRMRMRTVFTNDFLGRWLVENRFYHLERRGDIDHPEQRIQEDIYIYVENFITLAPTILGTLVTVVLYSGTLWTLSKPVSLESIGLPWTVHGYLPFIAVLTGVAMTIIVHFVGDSLTRTEITRQRLEAQFRNDMAGIRENAEMVAFEKGAAIEGVRLQGIFDLIRKNWRRYTFANAKLGAVLSLPALVLTVAPMALCAPLVLDGRMGVGDLQLVGSAFLMMYMSVSVLATSYREIAIMRSAVARMRLFDEALDTPAHSGIAVSQSTGDVMSTRNLSLRLPGGAPLVEIGDLELKAGDRLLVRGPSGSGKSTLMRALAGLWPYGSGSVQSPEGKRICFLPQRSYMPDGTLASLLAYPNAPDPHADPQYRSVLQSLGLGALCSRLHEHNQWRQILSPGEQQRMAAARALLAKPDFLFLDEASSALDPHSETTLYTLLDEHLPHAALISVAHRPDVARFHRNAMSIEDGRIVLSTL
ncbi:ATP-binding cassette domain-containing protein [Pseudoxanthomonas sp. CF125]|uniref:ABC transporter ATP-binding protein/permease n=1 Tax=Pseudoxanthomonas sp. CF125 TaxID=1855303 RepID=UPI00088CD386|nr:ATP-binding cassette domain-containing protein [Pseudoxanthomonas sp. CF125]SDQ81339.1 putative ATP-binding cassette transporter [Pseudoxanthomonas sp. CF125]